MEHHFRHAACEEDSHRRMPDWAVGEHIDETRHGAVHFTPVLNGGTLEPGGVRDGGDVQQQVRGTAERGVHYHGIPNRLRCDDIPHCQAFRRQTDSRPRRTVSHICPDVLSGGG